MRRFRKTKDITAHEKREISLIRKHVTRGKCTKKEADQRIEEIYAGARARFNAEHPSLSKIKRKALKGRVTYQRCQVCDFARDAEGSVFNPNIHRYPSARVEINLVTENRVTYEFLICSKCVDVICYDDEPAEKPALCSTEVNWLKAFNSPAEFAEFDADKDADCIPDELLNRGVEQVTAAEPISDLMELPDPLEEGEQDAAALFYEELKWCYTKMQLDHILRPERRWSEAQGKQGDLTKLSNDGFTPDRMPWPNTADQFQKYPRENRKPAKRKAFAYRLLWKDWIAKKHNYAGPKTQEVIDALIAWHKHPLKPRDRDGKLYPIGKMSLSLEAARKSKTKQIF